MEQLVESIAERVVNLVLDAIDINAIVSKVDVDSLIDRVDVQKIIDRVDVDQIVARVDVEAIIERVDVQAIIERVDIEQVIQRVDIDKLVEQTELGTIIAHSTSGVASEVLDVVRAQGVGLDDFVARWVNRILRRNSDDWPPGPPRLVEPAGGGAGTSPGGDRMSTPLAGTEPPVVGRQGNYAGGVTRLVAFAADVGASWGLFTLGLAGISFAIDLVTATRSTSAVARSWRCRAHHLGVHLLRLPVVPRGEDRRHGRARDPGGGQGPRRHHAKQAVIRTITPLSFLFFGLGFLGILLSKDRHAWHDRLAKTVVVCSWDARAARLRWLAEQSRPRRPEGWSGCFPRHPRCRSPAWSCCRVGGPELRVELVDRCRGWSEASGGPRSPRIHNGAPMSVRMVGLGWHWYPYRYSRTRDDGDGGRECRSRRGSESGPTGGRRTRSASAPMLPTIPPPSSRTWRWSTGTARGEDGHARRHRRGRDRAGRVLQRRRHRRVPVRQGGGAGSAVGGPAARIGRCVVFGGPARLAYRGPETR